MEDSIELDPEWLDLIKNREGWEVTNDGKIKIYDLLLPFNHPVCIHLELYRVSKIPEIRYKHLKAAHDYLWPDTVWHYWTERRFREHCEGWNYIGWAGGASTAKSYDAAKLILLFWWSNPLHNTAIIASTTLTAVEARVWGYVKNLLRTAAVELPYKYVGGNSPMIINPTDRGKNLKDTIHGIFAVAAGQGSDDSAIKNWIGRHPDEALMIALDECTDLNTAISNAFVNLDSSDKPFQLIGIGNSASTTDLHGALCTPKDGWDSVDPLKMNKWETTQKNGICLFFSCYESPAIFEEDPVRKAKLGKFLITQEQIEEKEKQYGKESDSFYRFVLGFWKSRSTEAVLASTQFQHEHGVFNAPHWLGIEPLHMVAGLDVSFSTGGDSTILQCGVIGQDIDGNMVIDFKGNELTFRIPIQARLGKSAEIQIAEQAVDILGKLGIPLQHLCLDGTGQGRAMGGTLKLQARSDTEPLKVYTVRTGNGVVNSFDVLIKTPLELWESYKGFIEHNQIKRLNPMIASQLSTRLLIRNEQTKKVTLESKRDYKKRMNSIQPALAHSPDEADAGALMLQAAMYFYGLTPGLKKVVLTKAQEQEMDKFRAYKHGVAQVQRAHLAGEKPLPALPKATFGAGLGELIKNRRPF